MKIKNIIPIFMALFVVACSTTGNNSRTTAPPENLDLGLDRAELSFYTELLDGDLRTRAERLSDVATPPALRYRRESFNKGFFNFLFPNGIDGTPAQASLTNDIVDQISFTNREGVIFLFYSAVQTRRGGVAGNVPQKFWRNVPITLLNTLTIFTPVTTTPRPTIFLGETGEETVTVDADFQLYLVNPSSANAFLQRNTGRTETLSTVNANRTGLSQLLPDEDIPTALALLIRTNATSLEVYFPQVGRAEGADANRFFLREGDTDFLTYPLVN